MENTRWDNFLESLRKVLVKIILPIRNKREKLLSNFRLSILFRVSMGYLKLLLTHGVLLMFGIFILYMYTEKKDFSVMADDIISSSLESSFYICILRRKISV